MTRMAGWDTHGLPVEIEVEKELGSTASRTSRSSASRGSTRGAARASSRYQADWEQLSDRIGYWLDYANPYVTYSNEYIESVWWLLQRLHERDLLYRGHQILPYCPRCGTALSSHELAQGYEDVQDKSIYVTFPLADGSGRELVVWTTTPWTLPCNVAVAVHPELEYGEYERRRAACSSWRATRAAQVLGDGAARAARAVSRAPSSSGSATGGRSTWCRCRPTGSTASWCRRRSSPRRTAPASCTWRRRSAPTTTRRGSGTAWRSCGRSRPRHLPRHHVAGARGQARHRRRDQRLIIRRLKDARAACSATGVARAHVPALLALREQADLLRPRLVVRAHVRRARSGCSRATRRSTGIRPRSGRAGSASGWRTTSTGRSRATATGARRCRSGSAIATRRTSR